MSNDWSQGGDAGHGATLEALRAELRDQASATQQFMYAASHDLREPARMVSSFGGLLNERYRDQLDERGRRYLDRIVSSGARLHALLDGLLALSRITTHAKPPEPVDCRALVEQVVVRFAKAVESSNGTIEAVDLPWVTGDARQFEILFEALIRNAVQYAGEAPPRVRISADPADGGWHFRVADEGLGISADDHERVFGVFEKGFPHHPESGVGMGLTIARRVVERHRGRIWLESAAGKGCIVHFVLPEA